MRKVLCLSALVLLTLLPTAAFAETVSIHGSTVFIASLIDPNKAAIEKETGLTLDVVGNSAGTGVVELVQGKADVAMIASSLKDLVDKTNAKKPGTVDINTLKAHEMGKTRIVFAASNAIPIKELTRSQISDILRGKIVNWKEVGGPDQEIIVITGIPSTGLRVAIEKAFIGGESISAKKREVSNTSTIVKVTGQLPEAIGLMTVDMLHSSVHEIKLDKPEEINLFYVTKGDPSPAAQKLIDATKKFVK